MEQQTAQYDPRLLRAAKDFPIDLVYHMTENLDAKIQETLSKISAPEELGDLINNFTMLMIFAERIKANSLSDDDACELMTLIPGTAKLMRQMGDSL